MPAKVSPPKVCVFFDTSVLFTKSESKLVSEAVSKIMRTAAEQTGLSITWCLPEVVVEERRFQMERKAQDLLPHIRRYEVLLGHGLGITEETLSERVNVDVDSLPIVHIDDWACATIKWTMV